jgi:hypothetical protein
MTGAVREWDRSRLVLVDLLTLLLQQRQVLSAMSTMISTRGKCVGGAKGRQITMIKSYAGGTRKMPVPVTALASPCAGITGEAASQD